MTGAITTLHTDLLGDPSALPGVAPGSAAELEALAARAALDATRARGEGTRRVYRSAWRAYTAWCHALGRQPLAGDPELVAMYATRRGTRPAKQATPAVLRLMLGTCAPGAVALRVGDVEPVPGRGVHLLVRRSKTDQHGKGQDVAVWANPAEPELCPAAALDA